MVDALPTSYEAPLLARDMLVRTWSVLDSLSPDLKERACYPLDAPERIDWDFIPKPDRSGISLMHLSPHQRTLVQLLLRAGLSESGYTKVLAITSMENILRDREVGVFGIAAGAFRHQDNYFLSFFGRPGFDETWGWRFLGHHISLSFTVVDQTYVVPTPLNLGCQPSSAGALCPLAVEEQLAFDLLGSLSDEQRATALIHDVAPADYVTRQVPRVGAVEYPDHMDLGMPQYQITDADREALRYRHDTRAGLLASDMTDAQRALLLRIVDEYVGRMHEDLAGGYREHLTAGGAADLAFSWAGGTSLETSHYYRIETGSHLIEFCNSIDSGNHIHSALRDLDHDLGFPVVPIPELGSSLPPSLASRLVSSVPRA